MSPPRKNQWKPKTLRPCAVCGTEFLAHHGVICSGRCGSTRWREANREHSRTYHREYRRRTRAAKRAERAA